MARRRPGTFLAVLAACALGAAASRPAAAQDPILTTVGADSGGVEPRFAGQRAQARFEAFRLANLPVSRMSNTRRCDEVVGRFCYWYDSSYTAPPDEKPEVTAARRQLLQTLDSLAKLDQTDNWLVGQRVRYYDEAGRGEEALAAARSCRTYGWWCDAVEGFALHRLGRYVEAEAAYERVLERMSPSQRCQWSDLSLYLDADSRRQYSRNSCGSPARTSFETRTWNLARTRYGMPGNDSRTEHFARLTYVEFLRAAPSAYAFGFDEDERELLLRFGWSTAWSRGPDFPMPMGMPAQGPRFPVIGHEPWPAHRFIPPHHVLITPTVSDSTDWALQLPPVNARYQPVFAKTILMLEHQQGLFRRGDTALVAVAYDVSKVEGIAGARLETALALLPANADAPTVTAFDSAGTRGVLTARAPWGPSLLSVEVAAPERSLLVRARYGIRPPLASGTRVTLSDLFFYTPYGEFPVAVEEMLPHALATQRVRASQPIGVFWEAYNTNPAGERITISLTVTPVDEDVPFFRRGARAIGIGRPSTSVSLTVEDVSTRGASRTGRALELDISTLKRGDYDVRLEMTVAGQYSIRTERRLVVIGP